MKRFCVEFMCRDVKCSLMSTRYPKILVADDHAIMRRTLAAVLSEELDARVELACDGTEALAMLRGRDDLDVAILDISMPGKTGLEVLRTIRSEGSTTRVIVISAHSAEVYEERVKRLGAYAFIHKEQVGECLVPCVEGLLQGDGQVS